MLHRVRVAGESMLPTLCDGEVLLVNTRAFRRRPPRAGEIVVAWHPDGMRKIVKRVVGPPAGAPWPGGLVHLRGDNPSATTDSDHYGPIRVDRVLGKVWFSASRWRRPV